MNEKTRDGTSSCQKMSSCRRRNINVIAPVDIADASERSPFQLNVSKRSCFGLFRSFDRRRMSSTVMTFVWDCHLRLCASPTMSLKSWSENIPNYYAFVKWRTVWFWHFIIPNSTSSLHQRQLTAYDVGDVIIVDRSQKRPKTSP